MTDISNLSLVVDTSRVAEATAALDALAEAAGRADEALRRLRENGVTVTVETVNAEGSGDQFTAPLRGNIEVRD